jgi:hypothetical protein
VMRSDRLKQVMQEIDPTFDEKNLGISKFSKFCQEAASKGLLSARRLENGQLEVDVAGVLPAESMPVSEVAAPAAAPRRPEAAEDRGEGGRSRRGGRGRGRGRGGERERPPAAATPTPPSVPAQEAPPRDSIGLSGERLTRDEAFDLLRRTVDSLIQGQSSVRASAVRARARELLGRDSESLSDRWFTRILKDAHDADILDLRRRGDDFEIGRAERAPSVSDQLAKAEPPPAPRSTESSTPSRLSLRVRGSGPRGRMPSVLPPELLSLGVVAATPSVVSDNGGESEAPAAGRKRGTGRKRAKVQPTAAVESDAAPKAAKRPRRSKPAPSAKREGKATAKSSDE